MNKIIYDLLFFIKSNNNIPSAKDLNIDEITLISVIIRCFHDGLLDKKIMYVNILGQIQCDDIPELAITVRGYSYLEENNPVGKLLYEWQ